MTKVEYITGLTNPSAAPVWDNSRSYIRAIVRDLQVECRVGLHPWERHPERPSRLVVNVELFAYSTANIRCRDLNSILDYDHIRDAVKQWPGRPHTPLIETFLDELVSLCFDNPAVQACRVSIVKPDIFNEAAAAGVELYRTRAEHNMLMVPKEPGARFYRDTF